MAADSLGVSRRGLAVGLQASNLQPFMQVTNTTDKVQVYYDWKLTPYVAQPGQTITLPDRPSSSSETSAEDDFEQDAQGDLMPKEV